MDKPVGAQVKKKGEACAARWILKKPGVYGLATKIPQKAFAPRLKKK